MMCSNTEAMHTQLVMNVPYTSIYFATYESAKELLGHSHDEGLLVQLLAGGIAGYYHVSRWSILVS